VKTGREGKFNPEEDVEYSKEVDAVIYGSELLDAFFGDKEKTTDLIWALMDQAGWIGTIPGQVLDLLEGDDK
jgi:hypothetical protein